MYGLMLVPFTMSEMFVGHKLRPALKTAQVSEARPGSPTFLASYMLAMMAVANALVPTLVAPSSWRAKS
jgi:hypothetical protein